MTKQQKLAYWERRLQAVSRGYAELPAEHRRILTPAFAFMHDAQRKEVGFHFALESAFYEFGKGRVYARSVFDKEDRRMWRAIRTAYSEFTRAAGGECVDTRALRRAARQCRLDVNRAFMRVRNALARSGLRAFTRGVRRVHAYSVGEVASMLGKSETEAEYAMRLWQIPHWRRRGAILYALPSGFPERFAKRGNEAA